MLQTAKWNLVKQQYEQKEIIENANNRILRLEKERDQRLEDALAHYLVHNHITDIPGIGHTRKEDILRHVYNGKLTDLHNASRLPGIGEQTQAAIDQWVQQNQRDFTKLLKQNFPGKGEIEQAFKKQAQIERKKQPLET